MFFKRKKTNNEQLAKALESMEAQPIGAQQLQKEKMPIIILDNPWHQLMSEIKTPQIKLLEKELHKLLKEQGKLNTDYIEYTRLKKEMLDTILELSHQAFKLKSDEAIKKIEDQQKMILKINEKLEQIEPRLDLIPIEMQQINSTLIDESVRICYGYIKGYREKSRDLDEEIQVIRSTLMEKTEEKKLYDKKADQLYQYLHQLLGPRFIEKVDEIYWEKSE